MEAEKVSDLRKGRRTKAFKTMQVRDLGSKRLSNGVLLEWHTPKPEDDGPWLWKSIPPNMIMLDGKLYDTEELRKWLRWA